MKIKKGLCVAFAVLFLFCGCGKDTGTGKMSTQKKENTVHLTMRTPPDLNPLHSPWESNKNAFLLVYDGLFYENSELEAVPRLAESYSVVSEGLEVMINLRTDVKWHSGKPFTADDVIYTFDSIRADEKSAFYDNLKSVVSWSKIDDCTVELFLSEPYGTVVHQLTFPIISAHFKDYTHSADGTGPFRVETYDPQKNVTLIPNENYFLQKPRLSGAQIQFVRSDDMETAAFTTHTSDLISAEVQKTAPFNESEKMKCVLFPSTQLVYLGMNTARAPFGTALTRQALRSLIDYETILKEDYTDKGVVTHSTIHPSYGEYSKEFFDVSYNIETARENLFTAGWNDADGNGIIDWVKPSANGEDAQNSEPVPFVCTILANEEDIARTSIAKRLKEDMRKLGMDAEVEILPYKDYLSRVISGYFDLYIGKIKMPSTLDAGFLVGSGGSANFSGYVSEKLDSVISAMMRAEDDMAKKLSVEDFEKRLFEECPIIPILFESVGFYTWDNLNLHAEDFQNPYAASFLWTVE